MPTTPKKPASELPQQRKPTRRERLRALPDLRDPAVVADLKRQAKLMAQHPENDAIDAWIEDVYDWDAWK